ncbi:hypothetical protein KIL84_017478 [Mauremys mutica]|uniref:Uncharacterized protein n=1 Tax=Mauremys mutica TaxID=74926 RepID=A0A9D4AXI0_9SAUR|nr:hypothetical protein KIL84_017478 [Mauremys mutica]
MAAPSRALEFFQTTEALAIWTQLDTIPHSSRRSCFVPGEVYRNQGSDERASPTHSVFTVSRWCEPYWDASSLPPQGLQRMYSCYNSTWHITRQRHPAEINTSLGLCRGKS